MRIAELEDIEIDDMDDDEKIVNKRKPKGAAKTVKPPGSKMRPGGGNKKVLSPEDRKRKNAERNSESFNLPQPSLSTPEKTWFTQNEGDFFEYLMSLKDFWTPEAEVDTHKPMFRCYVYRLWPKIDNGLIGSNNSYIDRWHTWPFWDEGQNGEESKIITDCRQGMLAKWGSGTYRLSLTDVIAHRPIAELNNWVIRPENINHFPPKLNYKTLLTDVNENKTYIAWRQQNGLPLPGEMNEDITMASPAQDKLMEKVIDKAFEEKPIIPVQATGTAAGDAAAVASVQLMANVVDRLMSKPDPVQPPQQSPNEAITLAVTLIEKLQPKGSDAVMEMLREDRENTRRENAELRKQLLEANRPKSLKEQLEEMQALKELMGGTASKPVFRRPEEKSFLDKHGDTLLQLGTALLGAYMQNMNANVKGIHPQQAATVQAPSQVPVQAPTPGMPQAPQQQAPQRQQAQASAQPMQAQQQYQQTEGEREEVTTDVNMMIKMVQQYLDPIALPLFNHLKDGEGEDFADWLIGGFGEDTYKQAAALEFGLLLDAISTHPIIGKAIEDNGIPIEKLGTFIEHFKNPDKYWANEEDGEDEEKNKVVNIDGKPLPPAAA